VSAGTGTCASGAEAGQRASSRAASAPGADSRPMRAARPTYFGAVPKSTVGALEIAASFSTLKFGFGL